MSFEMVGEGHFWVLVEEILKLFNSSLKEFRNLAPNSLLNSSLIINTSSFFNSTL